MRNALPAGALVGVKVLEFSQVMAGPYCAMLLADLGADVIKVEPPAGDSSRQMGASVGTESPSYWAVNRNKRGIVLDLKDPRAVAIGRRLAAQSDVVIEGYRPGTMERLGLGYDLLRAENPGLIYASVSGYGQTGPFAARGGFDLVAQGESGIMSITGTAGAAPVKCGIPVCDLGAALFLTSAILAAYIHRTRTGEGQYLETSLFETGVALSVWEATEYFTTGAAPQPTGSAHRISAPYQAVQCADGFITIGAANQRTWERLAAVLGLEALLTAPEFSTDGERVQHRDTLAARIESITRTRPRAYWLQRLEAAGVPAGPIHTYPEVFAHPQTQAREMMEEITHPVGGRIKQLGVPVKYSQTPGRILRPAPMLGEHTAGVLAELGYTATDIQTLSAEGVIRICPSPSR